MVPTTISNRIYIVACRCDGSCSASLSSKIAQHVACRWGSSPILELYPAQLNKPALQSLQLGNRQYPPETHTAKQPGHVCDKDALSVLLNKHPLFTMYYYSYIFAASRVHFWWVDLPSPCAPTCSDLHCKLQPISR